MPVDKFGRMSDTKTKDTGVSLTYINNNYVRSDGGTPITGSLDMKGNTIYNVADPVTPQDVATKEYVDSGSKHLIAVSTYYCGDLIKGEYQFAWGGNACKFSGFLMPKAGRIKKIKVRIIGKFKTLHVGVSEEVEKRLIEDAKEEIEDFNEIDNKKTWLNILYLNGNLFSIILFKQPEYLTLPVGSILSTYSCQDVAGIEGDDDFDIFFRKCKFEHNLANYPLSEGDVINIRTEIGRNVKSEWSYLFTFLIELDPL